MQRIRVSTSNVELATPENTPSDFELELRSIHAGIQYGRSSQTAKARRWQETEAAWLWTTSTH